MQSVAPSNGPASPPASGAFLLHEFMPHLLAVTARRVSQLVSRRLAETCGLSTAEWDVLVTLGQHGAMTPTQVGELTSLDKVRVSRSTAGLVHRGLLRQRGNPRDRRSHLLVLTRKGAALYERTLPLAGELEVMLATPLSRTEWRALCRTLDRLSAYLGSLGEEDVGEASE